MANDRDAVLTLLDILAEKVAEIAALKTVLVCVTPDDEPEWMEEVETLKILNLGKVHDKFASLRALFLASPDENLLPSDLDSVVRRALDTALEPDDPAPPQ
jgi:hypothetical protein